MFSNLRKRQSERLIINRLKEPIISQESAIAQVESYFDMLLSTVVIENGNTRYELSHLYDMWLREFGFSLKKGPSTVDEFGEGVVIDAGIARKGTVITLYPGLVYYPGQPLLLQSISNRYIFRCADGIHLDGNRRGLSRMMYRSCAGRDRIGHLWPCCDESWLEDLQWNPLGVGQIVNNENRHFSANVQYVECNLPTCHLSRDHFRFLPNNTVEPGIPPFIRIIALVALRDIHCGEEILSSYFTIVDD